MSSGVADSLHDNTVTITVPFGVLAKVHGRRPAHDETPVGKHRQAEKKS